MINQSVPSPRPFEEVAHEWFPLAKRFVGLVTERLSAHYKKRFAGFFTGSLLTFAAFFCLLGVGAWLSAAAWNGLRDQEFSAVATSLILAGSFGVFAIILYIAGRVARPRPMKEPTEILGPESQEVDQAGHELVILFKDLTLAAKRSLSPNEVLKPHALKVIAASTAVGFVIALNLNSRKES